MKNNRLITALGILILLVLLAVFYPRGSSHDGPEATNDTRDRQPASTSKALLESSRNRAGTLSASPPREPLTEHQATELPQFILPLTEGREVTLKGAVKILMEAYKDACYRSRTQPLALDFVLPDDSAARISFSIERGNFQAALAHLAALAGYTAKLDGLRVSFEPVPENTELFTGTFQVKPGFHETLKNQLQRLGLPHDASLAGMAAAAGLTNPDRTLTLSPNGLLLKTMSPPEMLKLETWLATLPSPTQIKASVKLIHAEKPMDIDPGKATPDQIREWLGTLANQPGVSVVQAPYIFLREMQEGTIEIINGAPTDWTGSRITLEAERGGLAILAKDTTEYRPEDRSAPPVRGTSQVVIRDSQPQVSLVSSRDGDYLYRALMLTLIDENCIPLGDQTGTQAVASEVPGKPGFVLSPFNNKIIDVRDIPSGTLVADPTYPPSERKYFRVP